MAFADQFSGTSLGTQWTFEAGTPATTLTVEDGECRIVAKPGASYEAPSQTSDTDTSFGIAQDSTSAGIDGDFDIAVQAPTSLRSWTDFGWGIAFYGAVPSSDHVVVEQRVRDGNEANPVVQRILSRVGGTLTTHVDDVPYQPTGNASRRELGFIRVDRSIDTWTIQGSWDGNSWESLASFTADFTIDKVKVFGSVFNRELGATLRVSETYDVTGDDLRASAGTLTGETTWSTDFTSGIPSWLEDRSTNGGTATVVSNILELSKTTADKSSAMVAHTERVSDVDLLVKFRINTSEVNGNDSQFLVFGIGGQYQTDQFSIDRSHIIEVGEALESIPLRVHLRNRNDDFNAIYDFGPIATPTQWANDQWQWVRFQRIGDRIRYRGWADGNPEPSTWDHDEHSELWEDPGRPWIVWASNGSETAATTLLVDEVTVKGVEVEEVEPTGVEAIPGLIGRWRGDSLDGVTDAADVEGWEDISPIGQNSLWRDSSDAPTYELAEIGGENAIRFSALGAQRIRNTLDFGPWIDLSATTMVAVLKLASTSGTQVVLDGDDIGTDGRNAVFVASGNWQYFAGTVVDSLDAADLNSHVVTTIFAETRTSSEQFLDGTSIATGDPGAQILKSIFVGSEDNGANPADAFIAEIFLFNRELTASDRTILHSYVQDRYGITVSDYSAFADAQTAIVGVSADDVQAAVEQPAQAEAASLSVVGQDATVTSSTGASANAALVSVSAQDATVAVSESVTADAGNAALTVAALDPAITASGSALAQTANLSVAAESPPKNAIAQPGEIALVADDASVSTTAEPKTDATPTVAALGLAALNATITVSGEQISANAQVALLSLIAEPATVVEVAPGEVRYNFFPPTVEEHLAHLQHHDFLKKLTWPKGISVVRSGDTFINTRYVIPDPGGPEDELTEGVDYFVGGHRYVISEDVALELIDAGYEPEPIEA